MATLAVMIALWFGAEARAADGASVRFKSFDAVFGMPRTKIARYLTCKAQSPTFLTCRLKNEKELPELFYDAELKFGSPEGLLMVVLFSKPTLLKDVLRWFGATERYADEPILLGGVWAQGFDVPGGIHVTANQTLYQTSFWVRARD